jgi:hypothetical protein
MRINLRFLSLVTLASPLGAVGVANASPIFIQVPGPGSNSFFTSSTLDNFGVLPGVRSADDFQLALTTNIVAVNWWGRPNSGDSNFQISFYTDASGLPGTVLSTFSVAPSASSVSPGSPFDPVFLYSANLGSPFHALAGTEYWVSVFNAAPNASWNWLSANVGGYGPAQMRIGDAWFLDPGRRNLAFELEVAVPEPATFGLVMFGLLGAVYRGRKRRNLP